MKTQFTHRFAAVADDIGYHLVGSRRFFVSQPGVITMRYCDCGKEIKITGGRCDDCFAFAQGRELGNDGRPVATIRYGCGITPASSNGRPLVLAVA